MGPRGLVFSTILLSLLGACATPGAPRALLREDAYARYYATESGRTLRVEKDGTVLDVTCLPPELSEGRARGELPQGLCPDGKIPELGRVGMAGKDWDMSAYAVTTETGRCRPLFTLKNEEDARRHSCWNRLWEVPSAAVAYPAGIAIIVGACTSAIWVPLLLL
ncbi:MAG: hypothetical protein A2506_06345 [Elusimicrobia bacterium RIFOXYD12_FULL_66_9]|nr:MAG: hypothetical protein A2506_06345 [Elusimicrobia bacterium RIFOXYD12_FULL_66_9]